MLSNNTNSNEEYSAIQIILIVKIVPSIQFYYKQDPSFIHKTTG